MGYIMHWMIGIIGLQVGNFRRINGNQSIEIGLEFSLLKGLPLLD